MKAIILAAGRGSRMGEGTSQSPKCMVQLAGKSLLARALESLSLAGFAGETIGIVTGYRQDKIDVPGARRFHNPEWEQTNMVHSLTKAEEWLSAYPCIISYSDIAYDSAIIAKLINSTEDIAITYTSNFWEIWSKRFDNPLEDLETFRVNEGFLTEIGNRPDSREQIEGQFMGLIYVSPKGWEKIKDAMKQNMPKPIEEMDMTGLLQHLINLGVSVQAIETHELWLECDNMNDVAVYEREYAESLSTIT